MIPWYGHGFISRVLHTAHIQLEMQLFCKLGAKKQNSLNLPKEQSVCRKNGAIRGWTYIGLERPGWACNPCLEVGELHHQMPEWLYDTSHVLCLTYLHALAAALTEKAGGKIFLNRVRFVVNLSCFNCFSVAIKATVNLEAKGDGQILGRRKQLFIFSVSLSLGIYLFFSFFEKQ